MCWSIYQILVIGCVWVLVIGCVWDTVMKIVKLKPPALSHKDLYEYDNNPYWKVNLISRSAAEIYLAKGYTEIKK
jgi:hypothetical protein